MFDEYAIADPLNAAVDNELAVMDEELDALEFGRVPQRRVHRHRLRRRRSAARLAHARRRRGARNLDLMSDDIDLLDDDEVLMGFMGVSQDDIDFVESYGSELSMYGQDSERPLARARTFFTEKVPKMVAKFKDKATLARQRAEQLERRAQQASDRAAALSARARGQQVTARRMEQTRTVTSTQLVVGALGVAAVSAGLMYLASQR